MSCNSDFKKDKCWSCEFFSGERRYERGIFLGDSVHTDSRGKCSNSRSAKFDFEINENDWCSRYQKWGVLQSTIATKLQKEESEKILRHIEKEKKEADLARYTSKPDNRTPEEIKRDQAEAERIYKRESINNEIKELKIKEEKIKKSPKIIGFSSAILSLLAFILGWIPYWYWDYRRASFKKIVEDLYAEGRTIDDSFTYEMYLEGLHAKEMRNSLIWIPLVILAIGIVATIILVVHANKTKDFKLKVIKSKTDKLKNELGELDKKSND